MTDPLRGGPDPASHNVRLNVGIVGAQAAMYATLCSRAGSRPAILPASVDNAPLAVEHSDLLILACPVQDLRPLLRRIRPGPSTLLLLACRGLEPGSGLRPSEIVGGESACLRIGALAGPLIDAEIARGQPVAAVAASPWPEVQQRAMAALHSPACRIYGSPHLMEVELASAQARILAAALGLAEALGLGAAARAIVISRGAAEGARLARRLGGDPSVFAGLAGIGELVAAATLPDHPDRAAGRALAAGERSEALADACAALLRHEADLPITEGIRALALQQVPPLELIAQLMGRQGRAE